MTERYLANENFPALVVQHLRQLGNDVLYAAENMVGAVDPVILQTALAQDSVLLTFDRDFGELVYRQRQPSAPGIVLFRLQHLPPATMLSYVESFLVTAPGLRTFFTVVSPGQCRQTPLQ